MEYRRKPKKLRNVISRPPDNIWYSCTKHNIYVILLLYEKGKIDEAISNLEKTVSINPKDIDAYKTLANISLEQKNYRVALKYLKTALSNDPNNNEIQKSIANINKLAGIN